jgi:nucleoside-diphosphate-sugar epimerase
MQGCSLGSVIRLNTCYTDEVFNGAGLIANLVRKSRQGSEVTLDNNGIALRDPLHIKDLSSLILAVYDSSSFGELFHAGGGSDNVISLEEICKLANKAVKILPGIRSDDYGFVMDIKKALLLGWAPSIIFRDWISNTK